MGRIHRGETRLDDGVPHVAGLEFANGRYAVIVDGVVERAGLRGADGGIADHPETVFLEGVAVGELGDPGGMAPSLQGVSEITFASPSSHLSSSFSFNVDEFATGTIGSMQGFFGDETYDSHTFDLTDESDLFAIESDTGHCTRCARSYNARSTYALHHHNRYGWNSLKIGVDVHVLDVNQPPTFEGPFSFSIQENCAAGLVVGLAHDPDEQSNL